MRRAFFISVTGLLVAALGVPFAAAEPPAEDTEPEPAKVRIDPFGGVNFSNMIVQQAPSAVVPDLFPPSLFGDGVLSLPVGGSNERRNGFPLPDDADWRVQAAQVGAMVVGFAALAALCGGGACMLSDSWLPDQLQAEPHFTPDPLPPNVSAGRDLGR